MLIQDVINCGILKKSAIEKSSKAHFNGLIHSKACLGCQSKWQQRICLTYSWDYLLYVLIKIP